MNFLTSSGRSGSSGSGRATIVGGDESALREFLAQTTGAFGLMGETTVYIGQLPPNELDIPTPLPPNARLVGAIVRGTTNIEILTVIDSPVEQAHAACESFLLANGWQLVEDFPPGAHGFVDSPMIMRRYCNQSAKAALMMNAGKAGDDMTSLRLNITHEPQPCVSRGMVHDIFRHLPNLQTPAGVKMISNRGGGMGGGGNPGERYVSSGATLATELPLEAVAQAYNDQLSALGWQQIAAEAAGQFATSTWLTTPNQDDTRWSAFFTLAADPIASGEYKAWLYLYEFTE